jgi:hypothetical protein
VICKTDMRSRSVWRLAAPVFLLGLLLGPLFGVLGCDPSGVTPVTPITTTYGLATGLAQAFCARQACCGAPRDASVPSDGSVDADSTMPGGSCSADAGAFALDASTGADAGSTCQSRELFAISEQLALVSTAVAEGLLVINSTPATTCVAAYQDRPCDGTQETFDVQDALASCPGLFTGYIPVGERCDMTPECVAESFCLAQGTGRNVTSITGSGSLGVCFPYEELGQACSTSDDCDPSSGLRCDAVKLTCQPSSTSSTSPADAGS